MVWNFQTDTLLDICEENACQEMDGNSKVAVLRTKTLTLSPCCPADCADFMALEREPEVMRFLNDGYAVNQQLSDANSPFLMPRGTELYVWTARRTANGIFVGWFCLWPESESVAELGFRLRRMDWSRGLATEGTSALINWGFRHGGYDRIFACAITVNRASRRAIETIGLNYVRTLSFDWPDRFPGVEEGEVQYELLRRKQIIGLQLAGNA